MCWGNRHTYEHWYEFKPRTLVRTFDKRSWYQKFVDIPVRNIMDYQSAHMVGTFMAEIVERLHLIDIPLLNWVCNVQTKHGSLSQVSEFSYYFGQLSRFILRNSHQSHWKCFRQTERSENVHHAKNILTIVSNVSSKPFSYLTVNTQTISIM
jgi:hypothetical protein